MNKRDWRAVNARFSSVLTGLEGLEVRANWTDLSQVAALIRDPTTISVYVRPARGTYPEARGSFRS